MWRATTINVNVYQTETTREFLKKVVDLCKEYKVSISHEDEQGSFLVVPFNDNLANWLLEADDNTSF